MALTPSSYNVRQAIRWIVDRRLEDPKAGLFALVSEASRRFDLSPKEETELFALLKSGQAPDDAGPGGEG